MMSPSLSLTLSLSLSLHLSLSLYIYIYISLVAKTPVKGITEKVAVGGRKPKRYPNKKKRDPD